MNTVGLVQINNSFSGQSYLPYSAGLLQAYAQRYLREPDHWRFLLPIYSRLPVSRAIDHLGDADIVGFSMYVWNAMLSLAIARSMKEAKPDVVIVFGGPQVPERGERFLRENPFIDVICHGEGEIPFLRLLEAFPSRDWAGVPSVTYLDGSGKAISIPRPARIAELDTVPSPYAERVFDPLISANPQEQWIALWETNRGCPFSCTFCHWGSAVQAKLYRYSMERIAKDIDWFSERRIEFVYCCDANFGILARDQDIALRMAENKKQCGYPKAFSVQNTKNSSDRTHQIQRILGEAGLNKGVTLSLQSVNADTLQAVKRHNISLESFYDLQKRFTTDDVETYTDIILGLPNETYETFVDGVSSVIESGQHNRIQFNNLTLLVNSELAGEEQRERYGLIVKETRIINAHGVCATRSGGDRGEDDVVETQQLVVGTDTMPAEDWVKARVFGWWTAFLYFDKILQIPLVVMRRLTGRRFKDLIAPFMQAGAPFRTVRDLHSLFLKKAHDIQDGGEEYCESKEWLGIWWPADEYAYSTLAVNGALAGFYEEAEVLLSPFCGESASADAREVLADAVRLSRALITEPGKQSGGVVELGYNLFEVFKAELRGESIPIEKGLFRYQVEDGRAHWATLEEWCREVVWYGNKKGAYLFGCRPPNASDCLELGAAPMNAAR